MGSAYDEVVWAPIPEGAPTKECWNCGVKIKPDCGVGCPVDDHGNAVYVQGMYCTWNCCMGYILHVATLETTFRQEIRQRVRKISGTIPREVRPSFRHYRCGASWFKPDLARKSRWWIDKDPVEDDEEYQQAMADVQARRENKKKRAIEEMLAKEAEAESAAAPAPAPAPAPEPIKKRRVKAVFEKKKEEPVEADPSQDETNDAEPSEPSKDPEPEPEASQPQGYTAEEVAADAEREIEQHEAEELEQTSEDHPPAEAEEPSDQ